LGDVVADKPIGAARLTAVSHSYWTGFTVSKIFAEVAEYVDRTLEGVSQDRIVSVTHSMSAPSNGPTLFSVMVVLKNREKSAE
jgi:hypothetical protein